jgi:hypothetical protein
MHDKSLGGYWKLRECPSISGQAMEERDVSVYVHFRTPAFRPKVPPPHDDLLPRLAGSPHG